MSEPRYPRYAPEVNAILDLARAAREVEAISGTPAEDFMKYLERPINGSFDTGAIWEAFGSTELVGWDYYDPELQGRYQDIADEICERVVEAVQPTIAAAFLAAARKVLRRERRAQK